MQQTVAKLLRQESAALSATQQEQVQAKVEEGNLDTAVAAIRSHIFQG